MATRTMATSSWELAVQRMYEAFPYPHYPLLGKPYWQDGYLASSKFAGRLFEDIFGREAAVNSPAGPFLKHARTILVAGSGETLPYVMRQIEPKQHRLLCVDFSRRSLRRARFRLGILPKRTELIYSDINKYLRQQACVTGPFNHIDAYGVLHHLKNPTETLRMLSTHLSPHGTIRLMVYNSHARQWIHEIQAAFRVLKLDPFAREDREFGRKILDSLAQYSPALRFKLNCLGDSTLRNDARLVDTFFHAREARLGIRRWFEAFVAAKLTPFGLFDRYGELDDLPNPLWQMPSCDQLMERALDHRFENNLEVYLHKQQLQPNPSRKYSTGVNGSSWQLYLRMLRRPPRAWFSFEETQSIDTVTRYRIWAAYLRHLSKIPSEYLDATLHTLPEESIARLCRLGAIFPRQLKDPGLLRIGREPMEQSGAPASARLDMANFDALPIKGLVTERLARETHRRAQRVDLVMEHFKRAQVTDLESYKNFG